MDNPPVVPVRPFNLLRQAGLVLCWLALAVYFHTPAREAMAPTLDGSNFGSYAYFTAHHFQYGSEVVPMAGPYGFIMYGWTYSGDLFGLRTLGELLLNGTLAALTIWFFGRLRDSRVRWVWLAAHLAFTPFIEDLPLEWILLLGGLYLIQAPAAGGPGWRRWLVAAVLALVSLVKGTQLILGIATVGVACGALAWQRQWRQAALLGAGYFAALLGWWLLAGQNPVHLPAYVRGIMELGGGYTEAMSIPTPPAVFSRALWVSAALAAGLGWALWQRRREVAPVAALLLLAGHAVLQWKHAIVRSDGHAYIYFHFAIVAALTAYLVSRLEMPRRSHWLVTGLSAGLLLATLILASRSGAEPMLPNWRGAPRAIVERLEHNSHYLVFLRDIRRGLEAELETSRRTHALPQVQAEIGTRSIDGFGVEQGLIPLNRLNYRPRPMGGGSFNAYTPYLMQLNRDFVGDPARRPDYFLFKPYLVDNRFLAQDDGLTLLALLQTYYPVRLEHEHLLLRAGPVAPPAAPRLLSRTTVRYGAPVRVPAVGENELLLVRLDVRPSLLGRLRSFLYKPAPMMIYVQDANGGARHRRLIPAIARSPFLLSPVIEELADYLDVYDRAAAVPRVVQFTLGSAAPAGFSRRFTVEFYTVPRPAPLAPAALAELRGRLQFPFANAVPESITAAFRPSPSVRFLHPPAEAVWRLAGDERSFVFHFGIDPEAYERGTTNGVDFIVEIRGPSGGVHPVFKRSLKPRENPADRGDQEARVPLPVFAAGSRLVLRTDPGEYGDNAWDWAYVNQIELGHGGGYAADLFPGFNRVPDSADAENAGVIELDGAQALLLHVPGRVGFNLQGNERKLMLHFGFLPGAYTGDGHTQGADYIVELVRAGQPGRELLRRQLRPVTEAADRGPQTATVELTDFAAGDVLVVRTAPIPGGGNSWGWTYLSRLVIE